MQKRLINKAIELMENGTVNRVLGWKTGEFFYDLTPAVFETPAEIESTFIFNSFSGANLSKYLIAESKKEGRVAVFLKPCDSYSFVQLLKEHRIRRENVYIVGVECDGMCDIDKVRAQAGDGILSVRENGIGIPSDGETENGIPSGGEAGNVLTVETLFEQKVIDKKDVLLERCQVCKSRKVVIYDELIGEQGDVCESDRFDEVARLEAMTPEERFEFWRNELSRCIRCNACRNVCPACSCEKCVFDNDSSGVKNKAAADSFEENMFHIIRAFHVAGRCTDCGECSRVCPQNIPLHLLNRKLIKDINELYGPYMAGSDLETRPALLDYTKDDCEPSIVYERNREAL